MNTNKSNSLCHLDACDSRNTGVISKTVRILYHLTDIQIKGEVQLFNFETAKVKKPVTVPLITDTISPMEAK